MALSNLSTTSKISLLSVLIVIAVIAVVIPFLVLRGSTSTKATNITNSTTDNNIELLKSLQTELESLKIELKSTLEKADKPAENTNVDIAPMNLTRRRKRQTMSETTATTTTVKVTENTIITVTGQGGTTKTGETTPDKRENNKTVEEVVDTIIGVLDMVQKTREDIEKGISKEGETGSELSSKLHAGMLNIKDINMRTPAEKQLARELLTRIEKDEEDMKNTIKVLEDGQTLNPGEKKQQVMITKLTAVYTIMMKIETMLQSQLNITATSTTNTTNNTAQTDELSNTVNTTAGSTTDDSVTNVENNAGISCSVNDVLK